MMTDFRTLIHRMADRLDHYHQLLTDDCTELDHLATVARQALADPYPKGPTDEELLELAQFHCISYALSDGTIVSPYREGTDMRSEVLSFARAVLARWSNCPGILDSSVPQSTPPIENN